MFNLYVLFLSLVSFQINACSVPSESAPIAPIAQSCNADNEELLHLRIKYEGVAKDWHNLDQGSRDWKFVVSGLALANIPWYTLRALAVWNNRQYAHWSFSEKCVVTIYNGIMAGLVAWFVANLQLSSARQIAQEKRILLPSLILLKRQVADELKIQDSDEGRALLNDIENLIAQLA
jgi:hypothetical protein